MKKMIWKIRGERGTTLIVTLGIMVILVLIGIAALTTSSIDLRITGNERVQKQAFNWAEAGLDFGRSSPPESWVTINTKGTASTKDYRPTGQQYQVTVTSEGDIPPPSGAKTGFKSGRAYLFRINSTGYGTNNQGQAEIEMRGWVISGITDP